MTPAMKVLSQYMGEMLEYSYLARVGYLREKTDFDLRWDRFSESLDEAQKKELNALYDELTELQGLQCDAVFLAAMEIARQIY